MKKLTLERLSDLARAYIAIDRDKTLSFKTCQTLKDLIKQEVKRATREDRNSLIQYLDEQVSNYEGMFV